MKSAVDICVMVGGCCIKMTVHMAGYHCLALMTSCWIWRKLLSEVFERMDIIVWVINNDTLLKWRQLYLWDTLHHTCQSGNKDQK